MDSEVDDITITFNKDRIDLGSQVVVWKLKSKSATAGYAKVMVFYDCKGLQIACEGPNVNPSERLIPASSIHDFSIDYPEDYKFDRA